MEVLDDTINTDGNHSGVGKQVGAIHLLSHNKGCPRGDLRRHSKSSFLENKRCILNPSADASPLRELLSGRPRNDAPTGRWPPARPPTRSPQQRGRRDHCRHTTGRSPQPLRIAPGTRARGECFAYLLPRCQLETTAWWAILGSNQ